VSMQETLPEECGKVVRVAMLARLSVLSRGRIIYRSSPWRKVAYRREIESLERINARHDYLQAMRSYYESGGVGHLKLIFPNDCGKGLVP